MSYKNPAAYDRFMGRWSAQLAPAFLHFVDVPEGQHVLDVGCGTGSLSRAILASAATTKITGIDPVPSFVASARELVHDPRAQFHTGTAEALPFPDHAFDAALGLLVLQDFDAPLQAVKEMAHVTRRKGIVATTLWDFQGGMPMFSLFWRTAEAVAPKAVTAHRRQNSAPKYASLEDLERLWKTAGLSNITTATLALPMAFGSFDDFWQPFLGGPHQPQLSLQRSTRKQVAVSLAHCVTT